MTLPLKLTLSRIVLTFLIMALVLTPGWMPKAVALGGFLLGSLTDWLDGYLARRWREVSDLGALLDPIADKILVLGVFLALVQVRMVPAWMVLLIALREFTITGVRLMAAHHHVILPAAKEGKHKTVSQVVTILVALLALMLREIPGSPTAVGRGSAVADGIVLACLWVTVALTVGSGASFFKRHWTLLREAVGSKQ